MYTPQKTASYESLVALVAHQAMTGLPPFVGPVSLSVVALFPIPRSWARRRQEAARTGAELHTKRPDLDNVVKAIKDGLNGIVWRDDCQVVVMQCRKGYADAPQVLVEVSEV